MLSCCRNSEQSKPVVAALSANVLSDIMMAQDFHDLTGQVVAKVVALRQRGAEFRFPAGSTAPPAAGRPSTTKPAR